MTRSEQLDEMIEATYQRIIEKFNIISEIHERMNADDKELHER